MTFVPVRINVSVPDERYDGLLDGLDTVMHPPRIKMKRLASSILVVLICSLCVLLSSSGTAQAQEMGVDLDTVVTAPYIDPYDLPEQCRRRFVASTKDGEISCGPWWTLHHPSIWKDEETYLQRFDDGEDGVSHGRREMAFLTVGDRVYYSALRDLFEVDLVEGVILRRVRFPARIAGIALATGSALDVTLHTRGGTYPASETDSPPTEKITLRYKPGGPEPAQIFWDHVTDGFAAMRDAEWLVANLQEDDEINQAPPISGIFDPDEDEATRVLSEAHRRDPTNPFYAEQLGHLHREAGDEQAAMEAFDAAADSTGAVWSDRLALSLRLEEAGATDAAKRAYENGLARMDEVGIARERVFTTLVMVTAFSGLHDAEGPLQQGIREGDADAVHRLSARVADAFPFAEGGYSSWSALTSWMEEQGRDDLADQWRQRARENRDVTYPLFEAPATRADQSLVGMIATGLTLIVLSLVVGLRGGIARRRRRDDPGDGKGSVPLWLPAVRLRDLYALLLIYAGFFVCSLILSANVVTIGTLTKMPVPGLHDGLAAPEVEQWLQELDDSPAQKELLEIAREEQRLLTAGEELPERGSVHHLIAEAANEDAQQSQLQLLKSARLPDPLATTGITDGEIGEHDGDMRDKHRSFLSIFVGFPGVAFLIFLGGLAGAYAPRAARRGLQVVPGGPPQLAPIGGFVLLGFLTALVAFAGYDSLISELIEPAFLRYFGLDGIAPQSIAPSRTWAWIVLATVLAIQIWAVFRWPKAKPSDK